MPGTLNDHANNLQILDQDAILCLLASANGLKVFHHCLYISSHCFGFAIYSIHIFVLPNSYQSLI
jgi:hypothetical protein